MNIRFCTLWYHYVGERNRSSGFTMTELLIVIVIGGILSAIAIPTILNQAAKARQADGKIFISAINRSQQAYRLENSQFSNDLSGLGLLDQDKSAYYSYQLNQTSEQASVVALPLDADSSRNYTGAVRVEADSLGIQSIICEAPSILSTAQDIPVWDAATSSLTCPAPMVVVTQ